MIIKYNRVVDAIGPLQAPQDRSSPDRGEDAISNAVMRAGSVLGDIAGDMKRRDNAEIADARHRADQALLVEYTSKRSDLDNAWRLKERDYQGEKSIGYAADYRDAVDKFDVQYEKRVASGTGQQWFKERSTHASISTGGAILNASEKEYDRYNSVLHINAQTNLATAASTDPSRAVQLAGDAAFLADVNASRMKMTEAEQPGYRAGFQAHIIGAGIDAAIAQGDPETAEKLLDASVSYQSTSGTEKKSVRELLGEKASKYDAKVHSYVAGKRVDTASRAIAELPTHAERMKAVATSPDLRDDSERSAAEEKMHSLLNKRASQEASEDAQPLTFLAQLDAQEAEGIPITPEQEAQKVNAAYSLSPKGRLSYTKASERMAAARRATDSKAAMEQVYAEEEAVIRHFLETGTEQTKGADGSIHLSMVSNPPEFLEQHIARLPRSRAVALRKESYEKLKGNPDAITGHIETAVANAIGVKRDELYLEDNKSSHRLIYAVRQKMLDMNLAGNLTGDDARNAVVQALAETRPALPYQSMTSEAKAHADAVWDRERARNPALREDIDMALRYRLWLRDTRPLVFQKQDYASDITKGLMIEGTPSAGAVDLAKGPVAAPRPATPRLGWAAYAGLSGQDADDPVAQPGATDKDIALLRALTGPPPSGEAGGHEPPDESPYAPPEPKPDRGELPTRKPSSVTLTEPPARVIAETRLTPAEEDAVLRMAARLEAQGRPIPRPLDTPLRVPYAPRPRGRAALASVEEDLYQNPFAD